MTPGRQWSQPTRTAEWPHFDAAQEKGNLVLLERVDARLPKAQVGPLGRPGMTRGGAAAEGGDGSEGALLDRVIAGSLAASSSSSSDDDRLAREGHGEALLSEHGELLRLDVIGVEI